MTRLLFFGDLAPSGFGTVTMDLGRALLDRGEDVRFISQNEFGRLPEPFASRTIDTASLLTQAARMVAGHFEAAGVIDVAKFIPNVLAGKASDMFAASGHAWGDWRPDACILLGDFVAVRLFLRPFLDAFRAVPTWHYCPVEGVDLPPAWADLWRIAHPVAMSEFGADEIARVVGYRPPVVYHGVDADAFHPASPTWPLVLRDEKVKGLLHRIDSKAKARAFFGQDPRRKWLLRTDRHMPRKLYNSMFRALAPVLLSHPETDLVIHADLWDQGGTMTDTLSKFPKQVQDQVRLTGLGKVPRDILVALYAAADVYVSSGAEGFGLTIAEAIACGVPAVGIQYSSVPEVIGPAGMVVPVESLLDNEYDHFWARADEAKLGESVAWLLDHPQRARELGALGPKHVREHFSWATAAERFSAIVAGQI